MKFYNSAPISRILANNLNERFLSPEGAIALERNGNRFFSFSPFCYYFNYFFSPSLVSLDTKAAILKIQDPKKKTWDTICNLFLSLWLFSLLHFDECTVCVTHLATLHCIEGLYAILYLRSAPGILPFIATVGLAVHCSQSGNAAGDLATDRRAWWVRRERK